MTPAQFCEPPNSAGSFGAPPEKLGVSDPKVRLLIVTGIDAVVPSTTLPNSRVSGDTLKPLEVIIEPDEVGLGAGGMVTVGCGEVVSVGLAIGLAEDGPGVWQRGRVSPDTHGLTVGLAVG